MHHQHGEYGAAVQCHTFPLAVQSPLSHPVVPPCLAAFSSSAAAAEPVFCLDGRIPGSGELIRPAFCAGLFASIRSGELQQPRMQYARKFSSFHAAAAESVALHCSSGAHSLSSPPAVARCPAWTRPSWRPSMRRCLLRRTTPSSSTHHARGSSTSDRSGGTAAHLHCTHARKHLHTKSSPTAMPFLLRWNYWWGCSRTTNQSHKLGKQHTHKRAAGVGW